LGAARFADTSLEEIYLLQDSPLHLLGHLLLEEEDGVILESIHQMGIEK
jgi:hypothetical protein